MRSRKVKKYSEELLADGSKPIVVHSSLNTLADGA